MNLIEKTKKITEKHTLVFIISCAVVCVILVELFTFLAFSIGDAKNINFFFGVSAFVKIIVSALLTAVAFSLCLVTKKDFGIKGFGKGLLFGLPLLICSVIIHNGLYLLTSGQPYEDVSILTVCLFLLKNFMIGYYEEILCRGIMFNALKNKYGESGKGLLLAVVISSFIFGLVHLIGLIGGASLIPSISQVLYATFIGVFFCAIYIRTGSLWSLIIIHALYDVFAHLSDILTTGDGSPLTQAEVMPVEEILSYSFAAIIMLAFALYGLFLIRKHIKTKKEVA